jgi:hypothetical protein
MMYLKAAVIVVEVVSEKISRCPAGLQLSGADTKLAIRV